MIVRPFVPADADAVARVLGASFAQAYRGLAADDALDALIAEFDGARVLGAAARRAQEGGVTLVADDAGVLGYAGAGACRDADRDPATVGEMHVLYVHPNAWRSGAGRALQREALEQLRVGGSARATVWVLIGNPGARAFYEKTGWTVEGTTKVLEDFLGGVELIRYERALPAVRPFVAATDARAVAEVHVGAWRDAYRGQMSDATLDGLDVDAREDLWRRADMGTVFVSTLEGVLQGFVCVGVSRDEDTDATGHELYALNLRASAWGTGMGVALLRTGESAMREAGADAATLWVLETNARARRFYEREGWRPDGARKADSADLREVRYRKTLTPATAAPG